MCDRICKTCGGDDAVAKIAERMGFRPDVAFLHIKELVYVVNALLEYIDAIPSDIAATFPAMPGIDRDFIDNILNKSRPK